MRIFRKARSASAAKHADAVGVVGHQPRVILLSKRQQVFERGDIAVHGKNAISDDEGAVVLRAMRIQQRARMADIVVAEGLDLSARQLRAGVDACMRKFVQQHQAVAPDQHRNDAGIGEIAGAENASRLGAFEFGQACFQLRVERMIAGHQPRSS